MSVPKKGNEMEVFFYGLFMDVGILAKHGIKPHNPRRGYLNDYALRIGTRATLVPCKNERAFGIVMTIDDDAIHDLYAEPSVADYIPEVVTIVLNSNDSTTATCYNLPVELLTGTNESYAASLYSLAKREGFPDDYLEKISRMTRTPGPE